MTKTILATMIASAALALEANPPQWDTKHVKIVDPHTGC